MRRVSHHLLGESGVHQRELRAALGSCALTGTVVIKIIKVHTENRDCSVIRSDWLNHVHKCRFAIETAVEIIALVIDVLEFCGFNLDPIEVPLDRQFSAILMLTCCK